PAGLQTRQETTLKRGDLKITRTQHGHVVSPPVATRSKDVCRNGSFHLYCKWCRRSVLKYNKEVSDG
ncbi:MAG: hypothetical protein KAW46_04340, partial [candidate division Zixibacteria bacterium]|nr:hypothetical protein [candidate division Zixibacteria bacterium]